MALFPMGMGESTSNDDEKERLSESDLIKMDEKIINVGFVDPHQVHGGE